MHQNLLEFIANAGSLTGVSLVFLALTALAATATVEREINLIWGIRKRRPLARRLVVYALGFTAGPVLVGASIAVLRVLLEQAVAAVPVSAILAGAGMRPVPVGVFTIGLTLVYAIVAAAMNSYPNSTLRENTGIISDTMPNTGRIKM